MFLIRVAVPTRYPPVVTWALVAIDCAVFFIQLNLSPAELEKFLYHFALVPARYTVPVAYGHADFEPGDIIPFFTMMFLHGGWPCECARSPSSRRCGTRA
jgi:membrane associated rhomboid family serine protease